MANRSGATTLTRAVIRRVNTLISSESRATSTNSVRASSATRPAWVPSQAASGSRCIENDNARGLGAWAGSSSCTRHSSRLIAALRWSTSSSRRSVNSFNAGSVDTLNVSTRCGLSPRAYQIRATVDRLTPAWRAIDRVLAHTLG